MIDLMLVQVFSQRINGIIHLVDPSSKGLFQGVKVGKCAWLYPFHFDMLLDLIHSGTNQFLADASNDQKGTLLERVCWMISW